MKPLRNLAEIRMGYTFRGSLKAASAGNTAVLQMKDASPDGVLQPQAFARAQIPHLSAHYLLRPGDLIFRSRGLQNTTVLIEQELERTVCVAPLMVIRVLPSQLVLPGYLHWFINLADTQQRLDAYARGTTVRMISAESLEGLEIVVPPIERQQKIVAATELNQQIRALEAKLAEKRQRYTDEALLLYARGASHPACA